MEKFIELLKIVKELCENIECSECPFSVGIYQEELNYTYYFCDIRKKPREWDLEKKRIKQDKNKEESKDKKQRKPRQSRKTKK